MGFAEDLRGLGGELGRLEGDLGYRGRGHRMVAQIKRGLRVLAEHLGKLCGGFGGYLEVLGGSRKAWRGFGR